MLFNAPAGFFADAALDITDDLVRNNPSRESNMRTALMGSVSQSSLEGDNPLQDYMDHTQLLLDEVETRGERDIRLNAAHKQQARQMEALVGLQQDPEVGQFVNPVLQGIAADSAERRSNWALEEEHVDNLSAYARLTSSVDPNLSTLEASNEWDVRQLMWQSVMDQQMEIREDRAWGWGFLEMVGLQSFPFYTSSRMSGDDSNPANLWQNIFAGENMRDRSEAFHRELDNLDREQQYDYMLGVAEAIQDRVNDLGYSDQSLASFMMAELWDPLPAATTNIFNAIDNVPIMVWGANILRRSVTSAVRGQLQSAAVRQAARGNTLENVLNSIDGDALPTRNTSAIIGPLERQGGREAVGELVSGAVAVAEREGIDAALPVVGTTYKGDLLSSVSLNAINPWGPVTQVSLSEDVALRAMAADAAREAALEAGDGNLLRTRRLAQDEMTTARDVSVQHLQDLTQNRPARDIRIETTTLSDSTEVRNTIGTFGRADGAAFSTESTARQFATEYGLPVRAIRETPEGFWVDVQVPVSESGFYTSPLDMNASNVFSQRSLSARSNTDQSAVAASVLGDARAQRFNRDVLRPLMERARRAGAASRGAVQQVWSLGASERRWFTRTEFNALHGSIANEKHLNNSWDLYRALRNANDLDWRIRNDGIYRQLQTQGYQELTSGEHFTGAAARPRSLLPTGEPIFDVAARTYHRAGTLDALPDGHVVHQLSEAVIIEGRRVRTVIGRPNDFEVTPLSREVLPYQPGGHRMPQGNFFVRQAVRETTPEGDSILLSPRTHIGAQIRGEAQEWATNMNEAQRLLREMIRQGADNQRALAELLEGRRGYPSVDELIADARAGRFDLDSPFSVTRDRQLPDEYTNASGARLFDAEETADQLWARSHGSMYYGRRGEDVLKDYAGNSLRTLNVYEMMNRSLTNISRMVGYGDYKLEMINRFDNTYRQYMEAAEHLSPEAALFRGQLRADVNPIVRNSFEAQRNHILRVLGHRTQMGRDLQQAQLGFIDRAESILGAKWGRRAAGMVEWWNTSNPVEGLRGAAFDLKLGLLNVAQFPLQISTMLAVQQLSPVDGTKAFLNLYHARAALINPNLVEGVINSGWHKTVGMSASDYRAYMRLIRESGFMRIDGQHALTQELGPGAAYDNFVRGPATRIREQARFFFNEAETFNRLTASHVAFIETRKAFPDLAPDHPDFTRHWMGRADDYSFNMSRNAGAQWQHGLASIPTQFWSYSQRMLEAMLGRKFTRMQRAQLFAGQSILYGSFGVPLVSTLTQLGEHFGILPEPDGETSELGTVGGFVRRGLIDHLIESVSGQDLKVSERIGVGQMAGTIIGDLYGTSDYGEVSVMDFLGGATFSIWGDIGEDVADVVRYVGAELGQGDPSIFEDENRARDALTRLAMNMSSFSNGFKAWMIHRQGILVSSNYGMSRELSTNIPNSYAFAQLLSYAPGQTYALSDDFDYLGNERREERVNDTLGFLTSYRARFVRAVDEGNMERAQELEDEMNLWMRLVDDDIREEVLRRAPDNWSESLMEDIAQSVEDTQRRRAQQRGEF